MGLYREPETRTYPTLMIKFSESNPRNKSPTTILQDENNFRTHDKDQICCYAYPITTTRKPVGNLRFSQRYCCRFKSSYILLHVDWYIVSDVSESRRVYFQCPKFELLDPGDEGGRSLRL